MRAYDAWVYISIHAPREGGDRVRKKLFMRGDLFQSTPPARGATSYLRPAAVRLYISIHAPREGGDSQKWSYSPASSNFNPRPPRGGRPLHGSDMPANQRRFQSTPPARGATDIPQVVQQHPRISIHAPREGGDLPSSAWRWVLWAISIHAPREGGDMTYSRQRSTL